MMKRTPFYLLSACLYFGLSTVAWAADTDADQLPQGVTASEGKADNLEPKKSKPSPKPVPVESEEQKRLREKYPLTINGQTLSNQQAHLYLLKGIQQYHLTRDIFKAANEISSDYSETDHLLKIEQKGIITARFQPQDLVYGPEYAHISLRMRALQDADKMISQAISNFAQAQSLAPSVSVIPRWSRIAVDTRKAIRYHIQFYKTSLKAVTKGYPKEVIDAIARSWNAPRNLKADDTLTTRITTHMIDRARAKQRSKLEGITGVSQETIELDGYTEQLPSLDFEIKSF